MPDVRAAEIITRLDEIAPELAGLEITDSTSFRAKWRMAARAGLPALLVPEQFGGAGLNAAGCCRVLERLGEIDPDAGFNFALAAHLLAGVVPLVRHGGPEEEKILRGIAKGEVVLANAMTEPETGSAAYAMRSCATKTDEGYRLTGRKCHVSNAPVADRLVVYLLTDPAKGSFGGISAFVLPRSEFIVGPTEEKAGLHSCLTATVDLPEIAVEGRRLLGRPGAGTAIFQESMNWERICLGAIHLGEMSRLLAAAVAFINGRKPGGTALGKHQAVTHPFARLKARHTAARQLTLHAAAELDAGRSVHLLAAETKLIVSELYRDFAVQLHQTYGAAAFRTGHPAAELLANAAAATIYSGTSEIQCNLIARYLGVK